MAETQKTYLDKTGTELLVQNIDNKYANKNHNHNTAYDSKGSASNALSEAQSYTDGKIDSVSKTITTHTGNSVVHVTSDNKTQWNSAYAHSISTHAPTTAEKNVIVGIQKNGTNLSVDSSTRKVNIIVPTTAADVGADPSGSASSALSSSKEYTDDQINDVQASIDEHIDDTDVHFTTAEKTKLTGIETGAQVNTVTGVKGSSETNYRTGNINITKTNIGLANVNNTSDANKPVSTAQQTAIDAALASAKKHTDDLVGENSVSTQISNHNTSYESHNDIRDLIDGLSEKVDNFLDVDEGTTDQLSEVLQLIEDNKGTLDSLTTSKINVSDIIDNLTTSNVKKVLSAKQGVEIKKLIDALQTAVDKKSDSGHSHTITASASDDNVVILTGTNGTNQVTYSASHATSGVTAGTYKSVTVDNKGHVTAGSNPTTLSGYGITNAYTKTEVDDLIDSVDLFSGGTSIPSNADLNTYTTVGKYFMGSESGAQSLANCPTTTNFCMYVIVRTSGGSKTQLIIGLNGKMYVRSCNSSGEWRDWQNYATEANLAALQETLDKHTHSVATTSANGFMSSEMVTKLNGIAESADNVSFTQKLTSGTEVGTITINGSNTKLYAPTNTHYTTGITTGASGTTSNSATSNPYIKIKDDSTHRSQIQIKGSGATTVSSDANGVITISSTDSDTTYTSLKNPYSLTIQGNGTTLTNGVYDGSAAKTVNITPSSIGAAASSHGTHVSYSSNAPKVAGTASAGTASTVSRSDHVHPVQTSVSGNAGTATKLETARTISLEGDITGSVTFDGSTNVTMATSLNDSGVTAGSYGQSSNSSPGHSGTFSVPYITVDEKGLITSASTKTITLPSDNNTDTKVTNTLATTTKAYVTGTTSASTNTGTQVFDTGVYLDTTAGRLCVNSIVIGGKVLLSYNANDECLDFTFL